MFKRAITTAVAALSIIAGAAGVSNAATPLNGTCQTGEFCLYKGTNYSGGIADFDDDLSAYMPAGAPYFVNTGDSVNDDAGSSRNKSVFHPVRAYVYTNYSGASVYHQTSAAICGGGLCNQYSSLGTFNNHFSSHLYL
ncbi:peptidase inhibitor family I36 protein [Streptomyces sp. NPDC056480]|uniref:peptidase inhibitor family I36 protein n=1 Tax=Streptomyces sp. NPDC056480 TaxID=3345833 RepID=UPI0036862DB7